MANAVRMSAFMVNCSMCGEGVDISMMGDHVCKPKPAPKATVALEAQSTNTQNKAGRLPPARLDTKAANRPFIHQEQLAPASASSDSRSGSPRTPEHTTDHVVSDGENESVLGVQHGGHQPFVGSDAGSEKGRHLPAPQQYAAADPKYAPVSPGTVKSGGLLDKMKTIAPGPFDARPQSPQKLAEKASNEDVLAALPTASNIKGHHARSSTTSSLRSHSSKASTSSSNYTVQTQPPPKPIVNPGGYKAFSPGLQSGFQSGEPSPRALLGAGSRSNTFPNLSTQQSFGHPRRPSESTLRPSNVKSDNNEELDGNTFVRTSPPRDAGRRNLSISGKPPPRGMNFSAGRDISAINLAAEFGASNPYHTSTTSQSSNGTDESRTSKNSSRSSPPSSVEPQARRKPSVTAGLDVVTKDLQQAVKEEPTSVPDPVSPPREEVDNSRTVMTPPALHASMLAPESPMDPMISGGRLSPMPHEAFPPHARGPSGPPPRQPPNQARPPSNASNHSTRGPPPPPGPQQRGPPPPNRLPPNRGPPPQGAPQYGLPSRPNAPLMQQNGFPPPTRPSQNSNKGPPPPSQYMPYRSPTNSTFPPNQQNPPHPQGHPHPQGPHRRPSHVNIPSPHNEFPPHRRPSNHTLPSSHLPSPHLPSPGHRDPTQPRRTPGASTPNDNRPPQGDYFQESRRPSQASQQRPLQPPPMPADAQQRPTTSGSTRPTTAKGDCKGCGQPITGKSVSSADGRLTGRYHKECFVCKACSSPFPGAEFYVIRDSPYCERDYHRLNNSICAERTCGRGIEGEYLETERRVKYHPGCLRCNQCREVLKGDYFEVRGGVFCERDAQRQMQMQMARGGMRGRGGPGGLGVGMSRMEKRSTRLMMM